MPSLLKLFQKMEEGGARQIHANKREKKKDIPISLMNTYAKILTKLAN